MARRAFARGLYKFGLFWVGASLGFFLIFCVGFLRVFLFFFGFLKGFFWVFCLGFFLRGFFWVFWVFFWGVVPVCTGFLGVSFGDFFGFV